MRSLAGEGRTVLVSSHLMTEMAVTAEHLLVVGKGRLLADVSTQEFIARGSTGTVRVRSPRLQDLARLLVDQGAGVEQGDGALQVTGASCAEVGDLAARHGLAVHELVEQTASLESAFMEMTRDSVEYHAEAETAALAGGKA
jgi:ABC-2 type transport system ATP-binding protein